MSILPITDGITLLNILDKRFTIQTEKKTTQKQNTHPDTDTHKNMTMDIFQDHTLYKQVHMLLFVCRFDL